MRALHLGREVTLAALTLLAGCGKGHPSSTPPAAPIPAAALRNAEYHLAFDPTRTMHLVDGKATDGSELEGTMTLTTVMLDSIARGILPDGRASAAVILVTQSGGTGSFYDLAFVADSAGTPRNIATVGLGDRVTIQHVTLTGDSVAVTMVTHGPQDPMCCPSLQVTRHFALDRGRLLPTERAAAPDSR